MEATWSNETNRSFVGLFRPKRAVALFTWPLQLKGVLKSFLLAIFPSSSTGFSSWKSTSDRIKYICIWLCIHFTFTSEHFKWRFSKLFAVFHVHKWFDAWFLIFFPWWCFEIEQIWPFIPVKIIPANPLNLTDFFESQMSQNHKDNRIQMAYPINVRESHWTCRTSRIGWLVQ